MTLMFLRILRLLVSVIVVHWGQRGDEDMGWGSSHLSFSFSLSFHT